jgi:hypothetical protein
MAKSSITKPKLPQFIQRAMDAGRERVVLRAGHSQAE